MNKNNNIFLSIYNTGNVPGDDAGIIYIAIGRQDSYIASQGKYSREKGPKMGLGMFGGMYQVFKNDK